MSKYKLPRGYALVLRCCNPDMTSRNGFVWPGVGGIAEAPDWSPEPVCGRGLHGWLHGVGNGYATSWVVDSKWLVVEVKISTIVQLEGKVKFPQGRVVFVGGRPDAVGFIERHDKECAHMPVLFSTRGVASYGTATTGDYGTATAGTHGTATAGNCGTATTGDHGTATAGNCGTATTGGNGTATAGYYGTATTGDYGTATTGDYGTATAGDHGTATAGDHGTATAGYYGTATAGDNGTATAGDYGTATVGKYGTATAGDHGAAAADDNGAIVIKWHDGSSYRVAVGYIGEGGLKPGVQYQVRNGEFAEVQL